MSWAADNPEAWEAIELAAVEAAILKIYAPVDWAQRDVVADVIHDTISILQGEFPLVFARLVEQIPHKYLSDAEADYFGGMVDPVMSLHDGSSALDILNPNG